MKKINITLTTFLLGLAILAKPVHALTSTIVITQLPEYIREQEFILSYSAITADPSSIQVQFYYQIDGGGYNGFGGVLNGASNQIQVNSAQVGESDKKYCFKAEIIGGPSSNETCTTFDQNPPDAPNSYSKERVNPSMYRIKWRTPNNSDFSRVFIYRGEVSGFTADGSTKIGEVGGAKDTEVIWDNNVDPNKEYYYALRALDKAGNASGLVGDQGTIAGSVQGVSTTAPQQEKVITPVEETNKPEGQVLPSETEAPQNFGEKANNFVQDIAQFAKDRTKITVGIALGLIAIIGFIVYIFKKK